jgi:RNA polymerase sigma-70 factor, ECF subfamily
LQIAENILIEQLKKGDKGAFESVFKSYYSQLCAYANKFVTDMDDSEEIVQELFFQIWQKRDDLNILTSFKSYLFRSVHNSCLNYIKHKNIQQKHIEHSLYEQANTLYEFSDAIDTNELQNRIRQAIDKLPKERKKVFLMIRYDNLKYAEVAEKLSISVKTVENQMGSALKFMREELKEYLPVLIMIAFIFSGILQNLIGVYAYIIVF